MWEGGPGGGEGGLPSGVIGGLLYVHLLGVGKRLDENIFEKISLNLDLCRKRKIRNFRGLFAKRHFLRKFNNFDTTTLLRWSLVSS